MKILAILAHDKKQSLNHVLFDHVTKKLITQGHTVEMLDLYKHYKEIPFYLQSERNASTTNSTFEDYPFFQECKKSFLEADALFLCFPVYCFSVPAILKCWFEMLTRIAAEEQKGSALPRPLHKIKKVFVIDTMGCPWFFKILFMRNGIKRLIKQLFWWIGIKKVVMHEITSVEKVTPNNIQCYLKKIDKKISALF